MTEPGRPATFAAAMAELQTRLPRIGKDSAAVMPGKEGRGTWGYKYANLAAVSRELLPVLGSLGLSFTACPTLTGDGKFVLHYELLHEADDRGASGDYPLPASGTPQAIGSAITYARRYCLCAVTGAAATEDDDDAAAAEREDGLPVNRDGSLSRSRTTDEEKAAAGVMTSEQQAEHTALRPERSAPAERVTGDLGLDEWTADEQEDRPGTIQAAQRTAIMAGMAALGIKTREARLVKLTDLLGGTDFLGGPVESTNDLSYEQAARVLEQLHRQQTAGVSG